MRNLMYYSWDLEVNRQDGKAVEDAARELRDWAESQPANGVSKECGGIGRMIQVFFFEDVDTKYADFLVEDETGQMVQISPTLKEVYPNMCPPEGKAHIYISDLDSEFPEEARSKVGEAFDKNGVLYIWLEACRDMQV